MAARIRRIHAGVLQSLLSTSTWCPVVCRLTTAADGEKCNEALSHEKLDQSHGVFVSFIKTKTTPEEVKEAFSSFGTVASIHRPLLKTGRYVDLEFENPNDAKSAFDDLYILDNIQRKDEKTVRVNNVKIGFNSETLKDHFSKYGHIVSCSDFQNYRNYAFVYFENHQAVQTALSKKGVMIDGRKVQIVEMKGNQAISDGIS